MAAGAIEQRGLYFDEFEIGTRYLHRPGRTMTEGDNSLVTTLTLNTQALHLDAAWSATQPFGQRLVNSLLTLSTMVGASVSQLTQGTLVANLGFSEVSFPAPVFIGDTLYFETEIASKRLSSSRPGQGIVAMTHRALNQHDVLVGETLRSALVWCEGARP
jgi:acyl dehydratase